METIDTKSASEIVGIGRSTVREWVNKYGIPEVKKSGNKVRYSQDAVEVLKVIKSLKDKNCGDQTIRRNIGASVEEPQPEARVLEEPQSHGVDIVALVKDAVKEANYDLASLAKSYSETTYRLGQLEERNQYLERQLKALPSPQSLHDEEKKNQRLEWELEKSQEENKELKETLDNLKSNWLVRLLNKKIF